MGPSSGGHTSEMVAVQVDLQASTVQPGASDKAAVENGQESRKADEIALVYRYPQYPPDKYNISASVPPPPFFVRRIGRFYTLLESKRKDGSPKPILIIGPCYPMIFVTCSLIVGTTGAVLFGCDEAPIPLAVLTAIVSMVVIFAFCMTACRDPGIQFIHNEPKGPDWTWSEQAQSYRAPGVIYEIESQTLIKNVDHLCPWTGKVVISSTQGMLNITDFFSPYFRNRNCR